MPSKTSLMNRALRVLAGRQITSPNDGSLEARVCLMAWPDALDSTLADACWSHAVVWAALGRLDYAPAFGHSFAYRLPLDCLRVIDVRQSGDLSLPPAGYEIVGRDVYTDITPCYARYIFRHEDESLWPPPFCEAFSLRLAMEAAPLLSADSGLGLKLRKTYLETVDVARLNDAAASNPLDKDHAASCGFLSARDG